MSPTSCCQRTTFASALRENAPSTWQTLPAPSCSMSPIAAGPSEILKKTGIDQKLLARSVRVSASVRQSFECGSRGHRSTRGNSSGRRSWRSGCRGGRYGHRPCGCSQRYDRHFGSRVRIYRSSSDGSPRPASHFLSCNPRTLARHGCDAGSRTFPSMVSGSIRGFIARSAGKGWPRSIRRLRGRS